MFWLPKNFRPFGPNVFTWKFHLTLSNCASSYQLKSLLSRITLVCLDFFSSKEKETKKRKKKTLDCMLSLFFIYLQKIFIAGTIKCYSLRRFVFIDVWRTVAHRRKTQLNFCSETQQSFEEHNNFFENTTIFLSTQQSFWEHNKLFENSRIFFRTWGDFLTHNNFCQNTIKFSDTQPQTKTQQN